MKYIEVILLVFAYTIFVITIFVELICYKKNLEKRETIAFTFSLLLLIVSITYSSFFEKSYSNETTNIFTLLSMILVALTTPLNVMVERKHKVNSFWKKFLIVSSTLLFLATCITYYINTLDYIEYVVTGFLSISVILSMILIRVTKPKQSIKHREKSERIFAIVFMVTIPLSILSNYAFTETGYSLRIGFTLPLVFILLAGNKLIDDLQRLSLFKPSFENKEQHFKNYSITKREEEVALLLIEGKAYKQISEKLCISIPTVKTHTSTIYKKCNVKNRTELAALILN